MGKALPVLKKPGLGWGKFPVPLSNRMLSPQRGAPLGLCPRACSHRVVGWGGALKVWGWYSKDSLAPLPENLIH